MYRQGASKSAPDLWYSYEWEGPERTKSWEGAAIGQPQSEWTYDVLGRPIQRVITGPNGSADQTYTWSWDDGWYGARDQTTDPWGTTNYTYAIGPFGSLGLPTEMERIWADQFQTLTIQHTYDLMGRTTETIWPDGTTVETSIDSTNGLVDEQQLTWDQSAETFWPLYDQAYDPVAQTYGGFGVQAGWASTNGAEMLFSYDRPERITGYDFSRGNGPAGRADYLWGSDGQLAQKTFFSGTTERYRETYAYDDLKRVTEHRFYQNGSSTPTRTEDWTYDLLGNLTSNTRNNIYWTWDTSFDFSQPDFRRRGSNYSNIHWDPQGRLERWSWQNDNYNLWYHYDGAGRLGRVEKYYASHNVEYGYDVDDNLIFEDRPEGKIYRFQGWRHNTDSNQTLFKPLPQVALQTTNGVRTAKWVFLEPDGHAFTVAGGIGSNANQLSFEVRGPYGRIMARQGGVLPIDQFHGSDPDHSFAVVPFGVRHTFDHIGLWLQPEPYLYLGLENGDLSSPRNFSGLYAAGNPVMQSDRSGYDTDDDEVEDPQSDQTEEPDGWGARQMRWFRSFVDNSETVNPSGGGTWVGSFWPTGDGGDSTSDADILRSLDSNDMHWGEYCPSGCEDVASRIHEAIGGKVMQIEQSAGDRYSLGPRAETATNWYTHQAVLKEGRVYDSWTGPEGQSIPDYKSEWEYNDTINFGF